ncbi:hypothetical protein ACQ4LE_004466 [Meloidogyne hapla]|uniref:Uncharacterized protein n=1 Tax=Meloidogyne hapla TaxID=6305 RepID=A0A1I8AYE9_MELHA
MVQMPCLSNDILYIISEKLLFQRDNLFGQNDLRIPNAYTLFMYHSARNMCAFISHFSKMKRLDLSSYGGERCISFYKDEILPLEQTYNNKFAGPYFVNKKMFSDLLDAGLLHISFIQIKNFLRELSKTDFSATDNNNILKYLINIKECIHNSSSPVSSNLNILNLSVDEPAAIIKKHLITLISTNIENMEFCCSEEGLFECDPETFELALLERPSISMTRIKKIATKCTIEIKSTTNFLKNLMNYLQFLLLSCPNIEFVEFVFTCHSELNTNFFNDDDYIPSDDDSIPSNSILPEEFITYLEFFVNSIIEHLKALNIGNKNLKTKIEFTSTI